MINVEEMLSVICDHCADREKAKSQEEADCICQDCWYTEYAHELLKMEDDLK